MFNIFIFAVLLLQQRHGWKALVCCVIDIIIRIWNTHSLFVVVLCKYYNSVIAYYGNKAIAISSSLRFYSQSITGNSYVNRETCSRNHLEVKTLPSWGLRIFLGSTLVTRWKNIFLNSLPSSKLTISTISILKNIPLSTLLILAVCRTRVIWTS